VCFESFSRKRERERKKDDQLLNFFSKNIGSFKNFCFFATSYLSFCGENNNNNNNTMCARASTGIYKNHSFGINQNQKKNTTTPTTKNINALCLFYFYRHVTDKKITL
jgi:hypothetical protein